MARHVAVEVGRAVIDPLNHVEFPLTMAAIGLPNPRWSETTFRERRDLLTRNRRRFLVATPEARKRLRVWLDAKIVRSPMSPSDLAAYVADRTSLWGDEAFMPRIVSALLRTPEPVRNFALMNALFLSVGIQSAAWESSARFEDIGGAKTRAIVLGPTATVDVIAHELWHTWFSPETDRADQAPAVSAPGLVALRALAVTEGWAHRFDASVRRLERLVEAARLAWSGVPLRGLFLC